MTCCIVGLLILGAFGRVRAVVRRLTGRGAPTPAVFAPVAWRPAPGQQPPAAAATPVRSAPEPSPVLRYCALGIAICLVGAPLLVWSGAVRHTGSGWVWLLRDGCYLAAILVAIRLSRSAGMWRAPRGVGSLLIVLGAVIFELSMLDMHIFRLFTIDSANVWGLMAFHNVGPALAIAGAIVLALGPTAARPALSRSAL
ncbi:MAG: hypothetical protein KDB47_12120 [Mycobacterium sp.]|nr:hypothetical protein [Mycobacterium sp.]